MSKREPALYLQDILISIAKIKKSTRKLSYEDFYNNEDKVAATVRNIEILWKTIHEDLATLKKLIKKAIKELNTDVSS